MLVCVLRLPDWTKTHLPKAMSLIASGETGPIHMPLAVRLLVITSSMAENFETNAR
jgi:hypothetical protein